MRESINDPDRNNVKSTVSRCMVAIRETWVSTRRKRHVGLSITRKRDGNMTRRGPRICESPDAALFAGSCWRCSPLPGSTLVHGSARTGSSWRSSASSWRLSVMPWTAASPCATTVSLPLAFLFTDKIFMNVRRKELQLQKLMLETFEIILSCH